jgi:hypothetical protein
VGAGVPPSSELFSDLNSEEVSAMGDGSGLDSMVCASQMCARPTVR